MRKEFSLLIFNHTGSPIVRMSLSRMALNALGGFAAAGLVLLTVFGVNYLSVKKKAGTTDGLKAHIASQKNQNDHQRVQIRSFTAKINELKTQLITLNDFEKKIRMIANLEDKDSGQDDVFGVGGSMPEDLDPGIGVEERQKGLMREMHEQVQYLDQAFTCQQDRFKALYGHLEEQRNILAATPSIRPVEGGWVSSSFGYRTSPFTERREFHKGLDIATQHGSPIFATAGGVVTFAGRKGLLGKTVVIDHGHGFVTRYGHAMELVKKSGEKVKRGDIIAKVGNTGRSTGAHVHYEIKLNGVQVNPKKYILN